MARHVTEVASRVAQDGGGYVLTSVSHAAHASAAGAGQLLAAEVVADAGDRAALARAVTQALTGTVPQALMALLLPAVQAAREAPTRPSGSTVDHDETITIHGTPTELLRALGLSAAGAAQFLDGQPVSGGEDRPLLARVAAALLGGRAG